MVGEEAVDEESLLDLAAFFKRHFCGGFDGFDGSNRSEKTALLLGSRFTRGGKDRRIVRCVSELFVALARFRGRFRGELAGKGNCSGEEIAFDDAVDDAEFQRFVSFDRIAGHAHFNGFRHAGKPRKPLGACGAGDKAELHFGLANLGARNSDAIVAGHGQLQSAAESRSMNGYDHRLAAVFHFQEERSEPGAARFAGGGHLAEFLDVRAGDEGTASADEHCGFDAGVLSDAVQRF